MSLNDFSDIRDAVWLLLMVACLAFVPIKLGSWTWSGSDGDAVDGDGD